MEVLVQRDCVNGLSGFGQKPDAQAFFFNGKSYLPEVPSAGREGQGPAASLVLLPAQAANQGPEVRSGGRPQSPAAEPLPPILPPGRPCGRSPVHAERAGVAGGTRQVRLWLDTLAQASSNIPQIVIFKLKIS